MQHGERFLRQQHEAFEQDEPAHFFWQTENPVISQTERNLLGGLFRRSERFLEVGCGEGANLLNLLAVASEDFRPQLCVGVDFSLKKVQFAQQQLPRATFICADGQAMPFQDCAFHAILCRDVLHHVKDPQKLIAELARLCAPGGLVVFLEPNRLNPLMFLLGLARPFERGILRSSAHRLRAMLVNRFATFEVEYRQPLPITRVFLHYQFGLAQLGYLKWIKTLLRVLESPARLIPRQWWAYICVRAVALGRDDQSKGWVQVPT